ncbi:GtrA family protein [Actinoplanes sp. NPDC051346]|uniref:GtrA family protein n=1 Tax=Actinoplanes sp. NPDC051346 TaxID=3155048 RepID=UPI003449B489
MRNFDVGRVLRYGVSGAASTFTHLGVALALHDGAGLWPVVASTAGFVASIVVSYTLQRNWVFRSAVGHGVGAARFLTVTAVAWTVNTVIVGTGTSVLGLPYPYVQAVAIVIIPVVNYALNSRWTFTAATPPAPEPAAGCTRS